MREIIRIDENTWRIEDNGVRFYLLTGTERAMMIDTGKTAPEARKIAEGLTKLPIELVNTHGDGDHTSGNAAFGRFYMHRADYENCRVGQKFPSCELLELCEGMVFDLGGRKIEVYEIPGHTYGSVALIDTENRVLYPGDTVQDGHIFMFGAHRCPEKLEAALEKLIALRPKYDRIYTFHGTPELPADYTEKVLVGWRTVLSGAAQGSDKEVFGTVVNSIDTEYCGFYCNK